MKLKLAVLSLLATIPCQVFSQEAELTQTQVKDTFYMLSGDGGNIGVFIGDDGTFVIDDQMAPVVPVMMEKIKKLGGDTPNFLINTHFHFDHTGGNENIGKLGSTIYSHHNTRARLVTGAEFPAFDVMIPPAPKIALPVVTFSKDMHFHINDDTLRAVHFPAAHTDGDSVVFFDKLNVLHTGDIFFNGLYPFIDTRHGGSLAGVIAAVQQLLEMTNKDTKIIPGHGPLATRTDLKAYHDLLVFTQNTFTDAASEGLSVDALIAKKPLKD